jgi:hypothetical protein
MSNYAPNPKKQSIYNNLAQKRLDDVSASEIQRQTDPVFLQAENQDDLITMNIINQAAMRNGLPIPDTQKIEAQTFTSAGYRNYLTPSKGEVLLLMGVSVASVTNLTGNVVVEVDINDGTNRVLLFDSSHSSSSDFPIIESGAMSPIYLTYPNTLRLRCEGTFDSVNDVSVLYCRVR